MHASNDHLNTLRRLVSQFGVIGFRHFSSILDVTRSIFFSNSILKSWDILGHLGILTSKSSAYSSKHSWPAMGQQLQEAQETGPHRQHRDLETRLTMCDKNHLVVYIPNICLVHKIVCYMSQLYELHLSGACTKWWDFEKHLQFSSGHRSTWIFPNNSMSYPTYDMFCRQFATRLFEGQKLNQLPLSSCWGGLLQHFKQQDISKKRYLKWMSQHIFYNFLCNIRTSEIVVTLKFKWYPQFSGSWTLWGLGRVIIHVKSFTAEIHHFWRQ